VNPTIDSKNINRARDLTRFQLTSIANLVYPQMVMKPGTTFVAKNMWRDSIEAIGQTPGCRH